jgi:hypothetical protein
MTTLSELGTRELTWQFPQKENQAFELRADGEFGWLRFDDPSGVRAVGELDGQRWVLQHSGGTHPRVTVLKEDSTTPLPNLFPG